MEKQGSYPSVCYQLNHQNKIIIQITMYHFTFRMYGEEAIYEAEKEVENGAETVTLDAAKAALDMKYYG